MWHWPLNSTGRYVPYLFGFYLQNVLGGRKKEHFQQKKLNLTSALTTDITKLLIHHESQQHLEMIENVASHARERIQVNVLASRRES